MHSYVSSKIVSIVFCNDVESLVMWNTITVYMKSPHLAQQAVFHSSLVAILTRMYSCSRSNLSNDLPSVVLSRSSQISSRGSLFGIVRWFRGLQLTQNLRYLLFCCMNRIGVVPVVQDCETFPVEIFFCSNFRRPSSFSQVVLSIAPAYIFAFWSCRCICWS